MIYNVISCLCTGIFLWIATTELLTQRLSWKINLLIITVITGLTLAGNMLGHLVGLIVLPVVFVIIFFVVDEKRIINVGLAGAGSMLNILLNNFCLLVLDSFFHISVEIIVARYWICFYIFYAVLLKCVMKGIRKLLYSGNKIEKMFSTVSKRSKRIQKAVAINILVYMVIFVVNISMGEKVGYPTIGLAFNNILFLICLIVTTWLLVNVTKGVESEEKQKAMLHQQEVLENYVENLEKMLEETRAFRHDYKNILSTMSGYIRENEMEGLREFFYQKIYLPEGKHETQSMAWGSLKNIKPMEIKGFLYEKLLLAFAKNIEVQVDITENLTVDYNDMEELVRILGIFLDNAIEETETMKNGEIRITIGETAKGVRFCIENNYKNQPNISLMTQKGCSTKGEGRGNGLYWAEQILEKHEDMFHGLKIEEQRVVQELEVITK